MYVCQTCPVRKALEGLDETNTAAWKLFQRLSARFVMETRTAGPLLMRLTADCGVTELEDVVTRLSLMYDIFYPPRKERHDGA